MKILRDSFQKVKSWWMAFAHALGWINTRILLSIFYFVILALPAIFMKVLRKDPLQRHYSQRSSYWETKDPPSHTLEQAKHQF